MTPKKLSEVSEEIVDCLHETAPTQPAGIPSIRTSNIENGRLDLKDADKVSEETYQKWTQRSEPAPGDIILAREAPVGEVGIVPEGERVCLGQRTVQIRPDTGQVVPRYLLFLLLDQEMQNRMSSLAAGSTVDHLNLSDIRELELPELPPLSVQRRIADILGALDDKIELNRRMNETLEEMAQALYRHWFVDFGPFQDREFKDTEELGPIPKGWEVKPIKEVVDMLGGSTPKTKVDEYWDGGNITWFTPTDLTDQDQLFLEHSDRQITEEGLNSCSTNLFPPYSIMMTSRATVGVTAINRVEACTNQGFINIIPGDEVSLPQVYFWIDRMMRKIEARADGSTYPEISQRDFKPLPILVAPSKDVEEYVRQSEELFSLIENNIVESETLAETRDYLLPKLISGEIEVDAAEEVAEDTVHASA